MGHKLIAVKPTYHSEVGDVAVGKHFHVKTDDEAKAYVGSGLAVHAPEVDIPVVEAPAPSLEQSTLEQLEAAWDVEVSPEQYLEQFPDGPMSDLALRIVELKHEQNTSGE